MTELQNNESPQPRGELLVYSTADGSLKVDVHLEDETVWLTQQGIAHLLETSIPNISMHIRNIFEEGELLKNPTVKKFLTVRQEGNREVKRELEHYNLDVILSVGYRVKSAVATQFRMWATQRLREYLVKGFTMDDDRLKESGNSRYFEELLARIRDIRSSEKVFWRKILDIYATSMDYDSTCDETRQFFKQVQNKMHWATHGHTAAELIFERADAELPDMGVTNYLGDRLLKRDTEIAKNYLGEDELTLLNRMVTAYLEMAELQAMNRQTMKMTDWTERLNQFLSMTGRDLLDHAGSVSHEMAIGKAHQEYAVFHAKRLEEPTKVEKHFMKAEAELRAIEQATKTNN